MDFQMFEMSVVGTIMALIDRLKDVGMPRKFSPIVAIALGLLAGVFVIYPHDLTKGIVEGLFVGLSAIGVHSSVKNTREEVMDLVEQVKAAVKSKDGQAQPAQQQENKQ